MEQLQLSSLFPDLEPVLHDVFFFFVSHTSTDFERSHGSFSGANSSRVLFQFGGAVVPRLFRRFVFEQLCYLWTWLLLSRYRSHRAAAVLRPASEIGKPLFFCCIEAGLLERDVVEEGTHTADVAEKKTKLDNEIVEVVEVCTARQNLEDALAKVDVSRIAPSCDNFLEDSVTPTRRRAR